MKIEDQVVSLDLCKKLRDAGYPQDDGLWYYCFAGNRENPRLMVLPNDEYKQGRVKDYSPIDNHSIYISAPTVAELGEKLPDNTRIHRENGEWWCYTDTSPSIVYEKEGDARAEMWLYLKDKELL